MGDSDEMQATAAAQLVELDERRLLLRHVEGDFSAFEELVQRYRRPVYGYLVRCGIARDVCDDLFQDVFCRIHAAADRYRPELPLKPWIFTIAANVVRSHFRKQKVRSGMVTSEGLEPPDTRPNSLQQAEAKEAVQWLEQAMSKLPMNQREVVVLSCIENMSHDEIAQALDMPVNTVKTHLRRARLALARAHAREKLQLEREVSS